MKLQEEGQDQEAKSRGGGGGGRYFVFFVPQPPHKHYARKKIEQLYIVLAELSLVFWDFGPELKLSATMHTP
jgi:hypothetical protein